MLRKFVRICSSLITIVASECSMKTHSLAKWPTRTGYVRGLVKLQTVPSKTVKGVIPSFKLCQKQRPYTTISQSLHSRPFQFSRIMSPVSFPYDRSRHIHVVRKMEHRAFVALGSNLGDRVKMIEQACCEIEAKGDIRITRTSSLWETQAMYVLDQDKFVNGACEVCSRPI